MPLLYNRLMLSWIEIDKARVTANINALRALNSPGTALMVVIKANAYGHGLETVAPVVAEHADWLGVNCIDEAVALTRLGIQKPIAILGHTPAVGIEQIVRNGYRQALYRLDVAKALSMAAQKHASTAHVHLKIETGTNRQGIALSELQKFACAVHFTCRLNQRFEIFGQNIKRFVIAVRFVRLSFQMKRPDKWIIKWVLGRRL